MQVVSYTIIFILARGRGKGGGNGIHSWQDIWAFLVGFIIMMVIVAAISAKDKPKK